MNLKVGDEVSVDSKISTINSIYASGKHYRFILSDGREFLDLHKVSPTVKVVKKIMEKLTNVTNFI